MMNVKIMIFVSKLTGFGKVHICQKVDISKIIDRRR